MPEAGDILKHGDRELTFRTAAQIADLIRERDRLYKIGETEQGDAVRQQLTNTALLPGEGMPQL